MAPLMAIVDTTNISSHIVRSIEIPLREIINSTVESRISEMLKEEVDSLQQNIEDNRNQMTNIATLRKEIAAAEKRTSRKIFKQLKNLTKTVSIMKFNTDLDEKVTKLAKNMEAMQFKLQQKIEEHIDNNQNKLSVVKQDIATLRKETEERTTRAILTNFTKNLSNENKNLDEKVTKVNNNVDVVKMELQERIDQHIRNNRNQLTDVKPDITTLRKETEEKITRETRENLGSLARTASTENKDLDEKTKKLTNNVDGVQLELQNKIDQHIRNNRNQMTNLNMTLCHSGRKRKRKSHVKSVTDWGVWLELSVPIWVKR
ncbi:Hypothetical predicted protein [Mytilus galloprovincialis]|uniref:Uncharacterized protein n=1 Tax=Mytilus galloprovincialis TaxID=29158 RepID=A0A8B6C062_MYTGA|nr:Hypothetical predicted protein [Mytilus galloprovincialis]